MGSCAFSVQLAFAKLNCIRSYLSQHASELKSDGTSVYMKHRIPRPPPSHDDINRCALQHRTKDPIMTRNPG